MSKQNKPYDPSPARERFRAMAKAQQRQRKQNSAGEAIFSTGLDGLSLERTASIWWSFTWRTLIGGAIVGIASLVPMMLIGIPSPIWTLVVLGLTIAVGTEVIHRVPDMQWSTFRLAWITENSTDDESGLSSVGEEMEMTKRHALMVLWSWIWRAAIPVFGLGVVFSGLPGQNVNVVALLASIPIQMATLYLALGRKWDGHRFVVVDVEVDSPTGQEGDGFSLGR